jgi:ankyrin repeat protein
VLACSSPLKKKGLVSRVKMLLDAGADRNAVSESGETLLQIAQKAKLPELLKLLKA